MGNNSRNLNVRLLRRTVIFIFLTNLFSVVLYHGLMCPGEYDSKVTTVFSTVFGIQLLLSFIACCVGNALDFNIRPLLIAVSFVDVLIVSFLVLSIWSLAQGDFKMNSYCWGVVWYVLALLLSKVLLCYMLKKDDETEGDG